MTKIAGKCRTGKCLLTLRVVLGHYTKIWFNCISMCEARALPCGSSWRIALRKGGEKTFWRRYGGGVEAETLSTPP